MLISHEELFLKTIQDLRSKIRVNKPYHLIRACGLCRHLLLDDHPLVHQVNKNYKLPITFFIKDYTNTPISNDNKGSGGRTILPIGDSKNVKLDEFLKTTVLYYGKHEFTVREVLIAACHYFGGIHSGKPDIKQEVLSKFERYTNMELKMSLWMMGAIVKVVLKSMRPLETHIKTSSV
ncbi:MAG: hypothetical protein ACJ75B_16965 [Flavisolibacter sp.]